MPKPTYDVDYFIKKFEAIPDEKWCIGKFKEDDRYCAAGHCGCTNQDPETCEFLHLTNLFHTYDMSLFSVNDGLGELVKYECFHHIPFTPKERILRALKWIKERIEEEPV